MTDLSAALSLHRSGRLAEAETAYQAILTREPAHLDATHLLGLLARQSGRSETAVSLIRRAITLNGQIPDLHYNLATALTDLGRLAEAAEAFRSALALRPGHVEAALGLANTLALLGEGAAAVDAYRAVIALAPSRHDATSNLGVMLRRLGRLDEAIASYRLAIDGDPTAPDAHYNLGNALADLGRHADAIDAFRAAIALRSGHPESWLNLAGAQSAAGDFAAAEASYRHALEIRPDYLEAVNNLGKMLQSLGRYDEALACFETAVGLAPENGDVRYNRALLLLLVGRLAEGWAEHEWRWRAKGFPSPKRSFDRPQWDGHVNLRATLLVHAEQGLGDTFQFVRYIAAARQRVGRVVFEAPRPLRRALKGVAGIDEVFAAGDPPPAFDFHAPLLSLAFLLGEDAAPSSAYIAAEPKLAEIWRRRLVERSAAGKERLKVGVVWAGNPKHGNDANRSLPFEILKSLVGMMDASLYGLQLGPRRDDLAQADLSARIVDLAGHISDFADTAAALTALDLLVSVDTAVAHLAGALGRPVWVLLPFAPDWRWQIKGTETRWYPSMRLIRQTDRGDWTTPIRDVHELLSRSRHAD